MYIYIQYMYCFFLGVLVNALPLLFGERRVLSPEAVVHSCCFLLFFGLFAHVDTVVSYIFFLFRGAAGDCSNKPCIRAVLFRFESVCFCGAYCIRFSNFTICFGENRGGSTRYCTLSLLAKMTVSSDTAGSGLVL